MSLRFHLDRRTGGMARALERGGADMVLICTNTMHKVADQVEAAVTIPLVHLADATAASINLTAPVLRAFRAPSRTKNQLWLFIAVAGIRIPIGQSFMLHAAALPNTLVNTFCRRAGSYMYPLAIRLASAITPVGVKTSFDRVV